MENRLSKVFLVQKNCWRWDTTAFVRWIFDIKRADRKDEARKRCQSIFFSIFQSGMSQPTKKQTKEFNEYEGGNGPRPPVPGKESEAAKMTSEGASNSTSSSSSSRSPDAELSFTARIQKWQESFTCLLADNEGIELLLKFVEEEAGVNSVNYIRLKLYFAVEGLKLQHEEKLIRRLIRRIR